MTSLRYRLMLFWKRFVPRNPRTVEHLRASGSLTSGWPCRAPWYIERVEWEDEHGMIVQGAPSPGWAIEFNGAVHEIETTLTGALLSPITVPEGMYWTLVIPEGRTGTMWFYGGRA